MSASSSIRVTNSVCQDGILAAELVLRHNNLDVLEFVVMLSCRMMSSSGSGIHQAIVPIGHQSIESSIKMDDAFKSRITTAFATLTK